MLKKNAKNQGVSIWFHRKNQHIILKNNFKDKNTGIHKEYSFRRSGHSASFRGTCSFPKCGRSKFNCFAPFPNAEGSKTVGLYRSQMRKATKQSDYTVPKGGRQQNNRIVPFPNAEDSKSIGLCCSQRRKIAKQQDCIVPVCGRHKFRQFAPFPKAEDMKTVFLYPSRKAKAYIQSKWKGIQWYQ